jgi:hypothetical protein
MAYHVLARTSNQHAALQNLAASVRVGGLLSLSGDRELPGFERLSGGLYLRTA